MTPYESYMVKLTSDLPFSVDHPYENEFENTAGGVIMGGVGTAAAMAAAQAAADPLRQVVRRGTPNILGRLMGKKPTVPARVAGKLAPIARGAKVLGIPGLIGGAAAGAMLGGLVGKGKTIAQHYHDARAYEEESGQELPVGVRHPYIMRDIASVPGVAAAIAMGGKYPHGAAAIGFANRALTQAGSTLYHQHEKNKIKESTLAVPRASAPSPTPTPNFSGLAQSFIVPRASAPSPTPTPNFSGLAQSFIVPRAR